MHYAWVIALTGALVTILAHGFGRMSYSVILPFMKDGLALSYTQLGSIARQFHRLPLPRHSGRLSGGPLGVRKVVFTSLIVIGVSLFLTGFSNSFIFAFFMRLISGAGNGGSYVPMMALPAAWFIMQKRGLATGIVSAGIGTGLFLSGVMVPPLISAFGAQGWRYAWFMLGIAVFVLAFVCLAFLRDNPAEKHRIMLHGGGEERKAGPKVTLFPPLRKWWSSPRYGSSAASLYFMYGFSYIIYITFFVAYLTKEMQVPPTVAGWIFSILGILSIFCGVIYGWISDVAGRRYGSMIAYFTLALAYLVFALWKDYTGFYLSAVIFGIAAFSIPTIMAAAAGDAVGGELAPAGLGFITLFFGIGQALGPLAGGYIKDTDGHLHLCLPPLPGGIAYRRFRLPDPEKKLIASWRRVPGEIILARCIYLPTI